MLFFNFLKSIEKIFKLNNIVPYIPLLIGSNRLDNQYLRYGIIQHCILFNLRRYKRVIYPRCILITIFYYNVLSKLL